MLTCEQCKEQLYPENPEVYWRNSKTGHRAPPLCDTCSYKNSPAYILEKIEENKENPQLICEIKNCPIWKVVAQLRQDLDAAKAELVHTHKDLHELQTKKKRSTKYKEYT